LTTSAKAGLDWLTGLLLEVYNSSTLDLENYDEEGESELAKEHLVNKRSVKIAYFAVIKFYGS